MKKFNRISSMDEGTRQMMQYRVLNKVNLEEAEEERVHGNRVDSEAGGGDDVRAHHDEQDWDEAEVKLVFLSRDGHAEEEGSEVQRFKMFKVIFYNRKIHLKKRVVRPTTKILPRRMTKSATWLTKKPRRMLEVIRVKASCEALQKFEPTIVVMM